MSNAAGVSPQSVAARDWTIQDARVQASLDHLDQGICIIDRDLRFVLANRRFVELLDFPENLIRPGTSCQEVFRFNAERGEFGPGNVEELVCERVDLAKKFELHRFERVRPNGTVLEIVGKPLPGGGVIRTFTDITERKRAEEASRNLSREKELILNAAGEGIYGLDLEGRTTFVNPAAARMIGWTPEELIDKPQHAVLHHTKPDGSPYPREECSIYAAFKDGKVHQVSDEVFWRKDGTSFPVEYVSTPIREDGKIIGAVVVFTDITERKRFEGKLWESNARLQAILDYSPAKIHIKDAEGRYTLINKRSEELFGVTDEEARGRTSREIFPAAVADAFAGHDQKVLDYGKPIEEEEEWHLEDGVHTYLTVKFPIHDASGKVSAVGAIGTDITERKHEQQSRQRAEDRLRDAIESIADGLVLFDVDDRVIMWNQRFAAMYPELAAMLPNEPTAEDMFRERYRAGAVGVFDVSVEDYVDWRIEMRQKQGGTPAVHRHSDGRWFRTTERRTTEGGVVAISTDVTELKTSEMDQRNAKQQAELANRSKSEFLANMSHELRTPLNAVIGFSEMIMGEILGPVGNAKYLEYAKDINASGQHLLALINDILDLSKIEAGKLELYEQVVDVTEVLDASMTLVKERAEEAALSLEMHVANRLPAIMADQIKVKQALINLLSNAVKFTGPGGTVSVHAYVETDGDLAIRVADTGVGIAAKDIPKVMEPFGQADNSLTRQHQGTGLGLPLSKALIELHEGSLVLESELGVGTTVTIRFPAERVRDCAA